MRTAPWSMLLIVVLCCPGAVGALEREPTDYEQLNLAELLEVVVTPAKVEQQPEDAPASIAVITCDEIRRMGYGSVGEAIRALPGIAIIDDRTYQHVGMRGFFADFSTPNDHLKIMLNGHPVSFRPNAAGFLGTELIPIQAVQRIEVLRGPGSALYGANAYLGVINIITFDGTQEPDGEPTDPGTFNHSLGLEGSYGANPYSHNLGTGVVAVTGGQLDHFRYFAAASYHTAEQSGLVVPGLKDLVDGHLHGHSPTDYPAPQGYPTPGWSPAMRETILADPVSANDVWQTASFYTTLSHDVGKYSEVLLDGHVMLFDKAGEFQEFSRLTHDNRHTYLNCFSRLRFLRDPGDHGLALNASLALAGGEPFADHLVDPLANNSHKERQFGYVTVDGLLEATWIFTPRYRLTLGGDLSWDQEDLLTIRVVNADGGSYLEPGYGQKDFINAGAWLQGVLNPWDFLSVTVGTRLDHNTVIGCDPGQFGCFGGDEESGLFQLSNRAGIVIKPGWAGLYTKLMYGSSFKPPSPYHLYHHPEYVTGSEGNPDLLPQTADTYEWAVGALPLEGLRLQATVYYSEVSDMVISYLEGNRIKVRNADARTHGLEVEARYTPTHGIAFWANASYLMGGHLTPKRTAEETDLTWKTSYFNEDVNLGLFPQVMANAGAAIQVPDTNMRLSVLLHYVGEREASLVNNLLYNNTSLHKTYSLDGYFNASLTASIVDLQYWGMTSTITAGVVNVPGGNVEPGRGGIDIPGAEPRVFVRLEQRF